MAPARADHRHRRPGRLATSPSCCCRGVRGVRRRAARARRLRGARPAASGDVQLVQRRPARPARRSSRRCARRAPREVYNLASPSFVPRSWDEPVQTAEFAAVGVTVAARGDPRGRPGDPLLPGVVERDLRRAASRRRRTRRRRSRRSPRTGSRRRTATSSRAATAAATASSPAAGSSTTTSRRGGRSTSSPARSRTPPRRSRSGSSGELVLGDLDARRDWGYARRLRPRDVADAAAGRAGRLRRRHRRAATRSRSSSSSRSSHVGLDWRDHVRTDPALRRGKAELHDLVGDADACARAARLGAVASTFDELVALLVDAELARLAPSGRTRRRRPRRGRAPSPPT